MLDDYNDSDLTTLESFLDYMKDQTGPDAIKKQQILKRLLQIFRGDAKIPVICLSAETVI